MEQKLPLHLLLTSIFTKICQNLLLITYWILHAGMDFGYCLYGMNVWILSGEPCIITNLFITVLIEYCSTQRKFPHSLLLKTSRNSRIEVFLKGSLA